MNVKQPACGGLGVIGSFEKEIESHASGGGCAGQSQASGGTCGGRVMEDARR
jgi:hypothetical protein